MTRHQGPVRFLVMLACAVLAAGPACADVPVPVVFASIDTPGGSEASPGIHHAVAGDACWYEAIGVAGPGLAITRVTRADTGERPAAPGPRTPGSRTPPPAAEVARFLLFLVLVI